MSLSRSRAGSSASLASLADGGSTNGDRVATKRVQVALRVRNNPTREPECLTTNGDREITIRRGPRFDDPIGAVGAAPSDDAPR